MARSISRCRWICCKVALVVHLPEVGSGLVGERLDGFERRFHLRIGLHGQLNAIAQSQHPLDLIFLEDPL